MSRMAADQHLRAIPARQRPGLQNVLRCPPGDQPPVMQQQDTIRPQCRQIKIVQNHADVEMPPTGQGFHQAQQMLLVEEIQCGGRFIKKQPAAWGAVAPELGQCPSELDPLLLASGECRIASARQG